MAGNYGEQDEVQARAAERGRLRAEQRRRLRRQRLLAAGALIVVIGVMAGVTASLRSGGGAPASGPTHSSSGDGGTLPKNPVVISFDDGYRPQYTFALPQLSKRGWPGVLNLKAAGSDLYESNVKAMLAAASQPRIIRMNLPASRYRQLDA
jgi:hypothetical protein